MAILTQCLGSISGKVGGIVFREKDGKTIVARAPRPKKKSFNPIAVLRQNKFSIAGKIASVINSSPVLHYLWKYYTPRGKSIHNSIFKYIYKQINDAGIPDIHSLMPEHGMSVNGYITPGSPDAIVETEALGIVSGINPEVEKSIIAVGIVTLSEPVDDSLPPVAAVSMTSESKGLRIFFPQTFVVKPPESETNKFRLYKKHKYSFHLFTLDSKGNPVHFTQNISSPSF